jgi:hypothetical protein
VSRAALIGLTAVLAVALSGCGGEGSPPGSGNGARGVAGARQRLGGSRVVSRSTSQIAAALQETLHPPRPGGKGSVAPTPPPGQRPAHAPAQAGARLRGHPLPTNQWWTSALVGPWTQPLIAGPVGVQVNASGIAVSYRPPVATPDHVVQAFQPAVIAGGPLTGVRVTGYGAFDVVLESGLRGGGSVQTTIVQGSPLVYLRFRDVAAPVAHLQERAARVTGSGTRTLRATVGGRRWELAASQGAWRVQGSALTLSHAGGDALVAVAPAPDNAPQGWARAVAEGARNPVVGTTERLVYDARHGVARQVLAMQRLHGGAGPWALTPLQQRYRTTGPRSLGGSYASSTGRMPLVETSSLTVQVPLPGFLGGVPRVPLAAGAREAVRRALVQDLGQKPVEAGSYFGLKELAREAAVAEVAQAIGDGAARREALRLLRPRLVDWLTYSGRGDGHYFAYDPTWGGLIGIPAEFGAQNYDDHHLQDGYLIRAAAVMAEADPAFARDYGGVVDAVIRDYAGGGAPSEGGGFPSERVWDPGVEHSWASGFALFADGNNQESSSEAVAAWGAIARWGLATGQRSLADLGLARYAFEAAAARMYWLGDQHVLPHGYAHHVVGIVWGDKVDYATWFSPAPAAIQGIQLLPAGFVGLYRWDATVARERLAALRNSSGGRIAQWGNVFAAEQALYDPAGARALLDSHPSDPEPSTSRALVRYLVETLAETGPPDPAVSADGPFGLAMRRDGRLTFLTYNPTDRPQTVTFEQDGHALARVRVPPHGSAPPRNVKG